MSLRESSSLNWCEVQEALALGKSASPDFSLGALSRARSLRVFMAT